ncbi:MAG: thioredoxin family protein, partial [Bacteroidales bacterium]|nr:thioredoxin family protein [Bacteroidales bacterium]
MDVVRKIAPGAQIPELTAYDIDGKQHSTNEIQTKYTILWFWDPDCDHCQEQTPILHDLYQQRADELNFEVFAVEVNDDYPRWKAFSEMNDLGDWINLSTSMGETSVDYIEYFDIVT